MVKKDGVCIGNPDKTRHLYHHIGKGVMCAANTYSLGLSSPKEDPMGEEGIQMLALEAS